MGRGEKTSFKYDIIPGLNPLYSVTLPLPVNTLEQATKILGRFQERRRPLGKLN